MCKGGKHFQKLWLSCNTTKKDYGYVYSIITCIFQDIFDLLVLVLRTMVLRSSGRGYPYTCFFSQFFLIISSKYRIVIQGKLIGKLITTINQKARFFYSPQMFEANLYPSFFFYLLLLLSSVRRFMKIKNLAFF